MMVGPRVKAALNTLIILVIWEILGRFRLVADGALPPPSAVLLRLIHDWADYPNHIAATLYGAGAGFIIGNVIAIAAGALFALYPVTARVARGLNVAIFSLPPIAISPILVLTLSDMQPRIVLAAIGCYFVTMTSTLVGLTQADARSVDVVRAYGGGKLKALRLVQARSALPVILSGLRIAAPNAVLGSILAEFGGGGRWGLGVYLLGSLGRAEPERLWGIGMVATLISGLAFLLFALIARRITKGSEAVTVPTSVLRGGDRARPAWQQAAIVLASVALPFALWWVLLAVLKVPAMIAKTPPGLFDYLFLLPSAPIAQGKLLAALAQTLPMTLIGMLAGLALAFALALGAQIAPRLVKALLPVALVTQTMPLVALTPLLVLMLGRGPAVILWITISVTFFPAFVTMAQGLLLVPRAALEVSKAYGANLITQLRLVSIPASLPYLFAATRLTAPRALLGVMIAEWLATGTGLGNLLNQSRGYLDYGMIWAVAVVSVLISVAFYQAVVLVERRALGRMGMATAE
ncbi:ABC transporter permease [Devosia sp.]|uniref:ABC transporter permease n=1 Tax=Devosia sp. TaxID=1871048 RepID=UPI003BAC6F28